MRFEKGTLPWWRRKAAVLALGGLFAAVLLFTALREMGLVDTWKLHRMESRLLRENAKLKEENARLRQEVERLRSSRAYIEEIARKELGLIGRNENVIVLDRKEGMPPAQPAARPGGAGRP